MSTLAPDLLEEIALTVDLGKRLTLIVVFGPGYLAKEGLAEIQDVLGTNRRIVQHRLDRLGPNIAETLDNAGESHLVVLVSGLERMTVAQREHMLARMNLLRDTLNKHAASVVMWVPVEVADEFRLSCADLFHWRALTIYVEDPGHDERRLRYEYLVSLASATLTQPIPLGGAQLPDMPVSAVGGLRARIAGESAPRDLDAWLGVVKRGLLRGPAGSGKTTALLRYAASRAEARLDADADAEAELPVFTAALWLEGQQIDWESLAHASVPALDDEVCSWLARRLAAEPALLLIDGIDELDMYDQRLLFQSDFSALIANNPHLRLVLTTRDWTEVPGEWEEAEILPLEPGAIAVWLKQIGYDSVAFVDALTLAGAEGLLSTPLLLQLVSRRPHPPELDLTSLIDDIVDTELGRWDFQRGVAHRTAGSREKVRAELAQFAAGLTRNHRAAEDSDQLSDEMVGVLDFVAERSAIIWRERHQFGFIHKVFHDFFAGLWLAEQAPAPDQFAKYATDSAWQLPTLHALWFLSPRDCESALECIWDASAREPSATRWPMRMLVLRAMLARHDHNLRARFMQRVEDVLQQARREAEPVEEWAPLAELVERVEAKP